MKRGAPGGPIQTLEVIDEDRTFDLVDCNRQGERVRFAAAGKRTHQDESAGPVVRLIGHDQCRPSFRLLASGLRIEVKPD